MPGRDRTAEFVSTVKSITAKPQWINESMELRSRRQAANNTWSNAITGRSSDLGPPISQVNPEYVDFMHLSKDCAHGLCQSYAKLEELTILARKRTLFDDEESSRKLNQLVESIKSDIPKLKSKIEVLQQKHQKPVAHGKKNIETHSKNVVISLQQKLAKMSTSFKSTLEMRSESLKQQKARRDIFAVPAQAPSAGPSHFGQQIDRNNQHRSMDHNSNAALTRRDEFEDRFGVTSRLLPSSEHNSYGGQSNVAIDMNDNNSQVMTPQIQAQAQQQEVLHYEDTRFFEERANTMQSIESTIVELGTIFNQLATMVQTQDETITRIDININDTVGNVEAAHEALLRYFASVNSNRWFILKVFGLLFFFFVLFIGLH